MRLPEENDYPLTINLVPMIDVMFSVLAFFILSTLFLVPAEVLNVNLPEAMTANAQQQTPLIIGIDATGKLYFQQQEVTLEQLMATLQQEVNDKQNLVVIQADEMVNHGRVVAVMDQLRQIQGIKLAIATVPPEK